MPLDTIALIMVAAVAAVWLAVMVTGMLAAWPFGIPALIGIAAVGYLFVTVLRQRLANAEDDHYERNIDQ